MNTPGSVSSRTLLFRHEVEPSRSNNVGRPPPSLRTPTTPSRALPQLPVATFNNTSALQSQPEPPQERHYEVMPHTRQHLGVNVIGPNPYSLEGNAVSVQFASLVSCCMGHR